MVTFSDVLLGETAIMVCQVLAFLAMAYGSVYAWWLPMNRVRTQDDLVGFAHIRGKHKKAMINRLRRARKKGSIPPPYPNGWFALAESRDVLRGEVQHVAALGRNLAVFRTEKGSVHVTDAYCPHLGADLTAGGKVIGDSLECPFHKWQFNGATGQCIAGPSSEKARELAKIRNWHSVETNGLILVWHHADQLDPIWNPVPLNEVNEGRWVYQGRNEYHVSCHIQDIPENGADPEHLKAVHECPIISGGEPSFWTEWLSKWTWHEWGIDWKPSEEEGQSHRALVELKHSMTVLGKLELFSLNIRGDQMGPALVHLEMNSCMGRGVIVQYVLPLEPMLQKVVHLLYTERSWYAPYAKLVLWGESILFERDVRVWNSKTYVDKPIASVEDRLILKHRRWFSQFYSDGSSGLSRGSSLDW